MVLLLRGLTLMSLSLWGHAASALTEGLGVADAAGVDLPVVAYARTALHQCRSSGDLSAPDAVGDDLDIS